MEPRLTFVTLGVADVGRATRFYAEGLRLPRLKSPPSAVFFDLGTIRLAIYPQELVAADAGVAPSGSGFRRFALSLNVQSRQEADRLMLEVVAAGGLIARPCRPTEWGGYAGYFADPDEFLWEVVWNPRFTGE
jgi:catechol 2,3-dioxygenase-like lactoylglutathione lyase family enzyme